ncbi:MAG: DUF6386 family protein [Planctomycetota bacterium]|nr:DUF6386 family protein [Planctomycetota bacterium]
MTDFDGPAVSFTTDLGTLALFDPDVLDARIREPSDWWQEGSLLSLPEIASGAVIILPLGLEGDSSARISSGSLTELEQGYARQCFSGLSIEVTSGRIFLGAGERIPGDGRGLAAILPGQGGFYEVPKGHYDVKVQALDWHFDDRWYGANGSPKADAPPDFVFFLSPRDAASPYQAPEALPVLIQLRNRPEVKIAKASGTSLVGEARRQTRSKIPNAAKAAKSQPSQRLKAPEPAELVALKQFFEDDPQLSAHRDPAPNLDFMGARFEICPANETLKNHVWSVDDIFKKVTRVREQVRVLEQKVNSSELRPMEKMDLAESVTGVYQSLAELLVF